MLLTVLRGVEDLFAPTVPGRATRSNASRLARFISESSV